MFVYRALVLEKSIFWNFVLEFVKYLKWIKDLKMHLSVRSGDD